MESGDICYTHMIFCLLHVTVSTSFTALLTRLTGWKTQWRVSYFLFDLCSTQPLSLCSQFRHTQALLCLTGSGVMTWERAVSVGIPLPPAAHALASTARPIGPGQAAALPTSGRIDGRLRTAWMADCAQRGGCSRRWLAVRTGLCACVKGLGRSVLAAAFGPECQAFPGSFSPASAVEPAHPCRDPAAKHCLGLNHN